MAPVAPINVTIESQSMRPISGNRKYNTIKDAKDYSPQWSHVDEGLDKRKVHGGHGGDLTEAKSIPHSQHCEPATADAFREEFVAPRCRNPDPIEPGFLPVPESSSFHRKVREANGTADATVSVNAPQLVIPKVVRVSPLHPKALRPHATMVDEDTKRRNDPQLEFPRTNQMILSQNNTPNGSNHRNTKILHPQTVRPASSANSSHASIKGKKPTNIPHSPGAGSILSDQSSAVQVQSAPFFQRLVSDEVQELKVYARIIEAQNRRLAELERVHRDLEVRLEAQSNRRMELEKTLEDRERVWAGQTEALEKERDQMKDMYDVEVVKNKRLLDHVIRKDQDIHRMLQRKYDHQRNDALTGSIRNARAPSKSPTITGGDSSTNPSPFAKDQSPFEVIFHTGSLEDVRERYASNALLNFFGMSK